MCDKYFCITVLYGIMLGKIFWGSLLAYGIPIQIIQHIAGHHRSWSHQAMVGFWRGFCEWELYTWWWWWWWWWCFSFRSFGFFGFFVFVGWFRPVWIVWVILVGLDRLGYFGRFGLFEEVSRGMVCLGRFWYFQEGYNVDIQFNLANDGECLVLVHGGYEFWWAASRRYPAWWCHCRHGMAYKIATLR